MPPPTIEIGGRFGLTIPAWAWGRRMLLKKPDSIEPAPLVLSHISDRLTFGKIAPPDIVPTNPPPGAPVPLNRSKTVAPAETVDLYSGDHILAQATEPLWFLKESRFAPGKSTRLYWYVSLRSSVGETRTAGPADTVWLFVLNRSEERRVGKECRSRWWPDH